MKRLIAALLCAAVALTLLVSAAEAAGAYRYRTLGPLTIRTNKKDVSATGIFDSSLVTLGPAAFDTTITYAFPSDFAIGMVKDSIPMIAYATRSQAGVSGDTLFIQMQNNYGTSLWTALAVRNGGVQPWMYSSQALLDTDASGSVQIVPGKSSLTAYGGALGGIYVPVNSYGARQFRLIVHRVGLAATTGTYSVYLSYPSVQ